MTRLKLDFTLDTSDERIAFLNTYLTRPEFTKKPPTEAELELCANYILWGKESNGTSLADKASIELEGRHKTWSPQKREESLDGLLEQPTFSEGNVHQIGKYTPTFVRREVFSRSQALENASPDLRHMWEQLFRQIDEIDLGISFYEIKVGKREKAPREELLTRFTNSEQLSIRTAAEQWTQFQYLKKRHELVELRREQYSLKDFYAPILQSHDDSEETPFAINFGVDIPVLPLGVLGADRTSTLLFRDQFDPNTYTEEELQLIYTFYWNNKNKKNEIQIDFQNEEHIYQLFDMFYDLEDAGAVQDLESSTAELIKTLEYYCAKASLCEIQHEILEMKKRKIRNSEISSYINKKYGKTYSANYISTIFRQKIIPQICNAATYHALCIENIYYPENWKRCSVCGNILLTNEYNFVRKTRSKDGFSNRCKCCDKKMREEKKLYVPKKF